MKISRKEFLQSLAGGVACAHLSGLTARAEPQSQAGGAAQGKIKRGVTLYSYQQQYYTGTMSLEDCLAEASDIGAKGIEMLPSQMIPGFPNVSERWAGHWHSLMDKYGTQPNCMDSFLETDLYGNRELSDEELVGMLTGDIQLAKRLGFRAIRFPNHTPVDKVAKSLPRAEQNDVKLTVEIHAPIPLNGPYVEQCVELIERTKTKHFGFTIDTSLFVRRPIRVMGERAIRDGIPEKIVRYIDQAWEKGVPKGKAAAEAAGMGYTETSHGYGSYLDRVYDLRMQSLEDLEKVMPYVYNVHAKFFEMTEDMREYSIPYDEVIPVFLECGYTGYLSSEYEGQRYTQDICGTDECEQIRREQVMLRRLLHEI